MTQVVRVGGEAPYDVRIGRGVLAELDTLVPAVVRRVAVLHQPTVASVADRIAAGLAAANREVSLFPLPDGEAAKTVATAANLWDGLASAGFTRTDLIIGVGGGAATDLAGFVAATWLRGVDVVQVPTTLAGMVDAAIGGKTGINLDAGKNLVGAFHPPRAVLCDIGLLATVPPADYAAGLAEVIKTGFIADPVILDLVEADPAAARTPAGPHTEELVVRSVAVKAAVVAADLRERIGTQLGREVLNYGHTLGHAIERREQYRWRHGDAVAVGLVFAAALARHAGLLDDATADRHRRILSAVGLPTRYPKEAWPELRAAMAIDKKTRGSTLRFVVLEAIGRPRILADPDPAVLEAAYAEVAE
ncbi:MAG: 3-dehydroquinate synthase [Acidothermus cellulolyticus]|nr:3-dehydroquinate synthase [Acidothermus cellulolyticus]